MKVILTQDVEKLGDKGEILDVASGYARNFLIPRSLALPGTPSNIKMHENHQKYVDRKVARLEAELEKKASKIASTKVEIIARAGADGKLYGSVTAVDIAAALVDKLKLEIDKRRVLLDHNLKALGDHTVTVRLSGKQQVEITVTVAQDPEEAAKHKEAADKAAKEAEEKAAKEAAALEAANAAEAAKEAEAAQADESDESDDE